MKSYVLSLLLLTSLLNAQSVVINEVMSSNSSTIKDEDNDYPDWIELYNKADTNINLNQYSLSDDPSDPNKWTFPNVDLNSKSFLLVFASGKNKTSGQLHTNFKIKSGGERIWLRDPNGNLVDKIDSVNIPTDISYGRNIDSISQWLFYENPTPGTPNSTVGYVSFSEPPRFTIHGGFYSGSQQISFLNGQNIYYTLDGSEPDTTSHLYSNNPIIIDTTTVIRARTIQNGYLPSKIVTQTFFIDENITLPVISLSTDPANLWDDKIGIYTEGTNGIPGNCMETPANWNQDWERPIHIEFFSKNKTLEFSIDAGVQIHGGCTRKFPQKSLAIVARGKYGYNDIPYQIFPNLPFEKYHSILLRNSGNDNWYSFIRDGFMHSLVEKYDLETMAYRPSVVFLNGKYWGLYNIRERTDKSYLARYYKIDKDKLDILRRKSTVIEGDNLHYLSLINYLENNELSDDSSYNYIKTQMDVTNYIFYLLAEMYFVNTDWFPGNMKFWRPKTDKGKWRWILFDTDNGFDLYDQNTHTYNMLNWVSNPGRETSVIYNSLIKNKNFKEQFINTFADLVNTSFNPEFVISIIDSFANVVEPEMLRQIKRWGFSWQWEHGLQYWHEQIDSLRSFAEIRIPIMKQHFINEFNLDSTANLHLDVNNIGSGYIRLNSIYPNKFPWSGKYFSNVPVKLTAINNSGYQFSYWMNNDSIISTSEELVLYVKSNKKITAVFEKIQGSVENVIINEINYNSNSNFDTKDWIELYNNSENNVDISNWIFKDKKNNHQFKIPENIILSANEYLVLCRDTSAFNRFFNQQAKLGIKNYIGNFDFKLSNNGELVRLYNSNKILIDSVEYGISPPWPTQPNGNGPTLELLNPNFDNAKAESWGYSNNHGSPGRQNDSNVVSIKEKNIVPTNYFLKQNYPNPFNPTTTIQFGLPKTTFVHLDVYNIIGEKIKTLVNKRLSSGVHTVKFDGTKFSSGVYLYRIKAGKFNKTRKFLLIK